MKDHWDSVVLGHQADMLGACRKDYDSTTLLQINEHLLLAPAMAPRMDASWFLFAMPLAGQEGGAAVRELDDDGGLDLPGSLKRGEYACLRIHLQPAECRLRVLGPGERLVQLHQMERGAALLLPAPNPRFCNCNSNHCKVILKASHERTVLRKGKLGLESARKGEGGRGNESGLKICRQWSTRNTQLETLKCAPNYLQNCVDCRRGRAVERWEGVTVVPAGKDATSTLLTRQQEATTARQSGRHGQHRLTFRFAPAVFLEAQEVLPGDDAGRDNAL